MGRKNVLAPYKLLSAQSLVSDFTSAATLVTNTDNVAYQINVTTTNSTGTFTVQASLDFAQDINGNITNAGNWIDLVLSGGTPTVAAANTQILIDLNQMPYNAIRLKYTHVISGTGVCDAFIMTRQIGG